MKENYYNTIIMIERMHRLFLDVLKNDLSKQRIRDINNIQAIIIYNVGHKKLSVGDLISHGYYQGSNVSYNLRKMVEGGYMLQCPNPHDRRVSDIELTEKGLEMYERIGKIFEEHSLSLQKNNIDGESINKLIDTLDLIEKYLIKI